MGSDYRSLFRKQFLDNYTSEVSVQIVHDNLSYSPELEYGILAIYEAQTEDEKSAGSTSHDNGVGFSAFDASYGTYLARYLTRQDERGYAMEVTGYHRDRAIAFIRKYRRQLYELVVPPKPTVTVEPHPLVEKVFAKIEAKKPVTFDPETMDMRFFMLEID